MASFVTDEVDPLWAYMLLTGLVVPRPIGWIGTIDALGQPNLAPYSFFQAVGGSPPTVMFSAGRLPERDKDSLINARDQGEFTCNLVDSQLSEAMNLSSAVLARGQSEFDFAGLTPVPSDVIGAPRVSEAKASLECRVVHVLELGKSPEVNTVVFGEVLCFHVVDGVLNGARLNYEALDVVGRMGGSSYCTTRDRFEMPRPR